MLALVQLRVRALSYVRHGAHAPPDGLVVDAYPKEVVLSWEDSNHWGRTFDGCEAQPRRGIRSAIRAGYNGRLKWTYLSLKSKSGRLLSISGSRTAPQRVVRKSTGRRRDSSLERTLPLHHRKAIRHPNRVIDSEASSLDGAPVGTGTSSMEDVPWRVIDA